MLNTLVSRIWTETLDTLYPLRCLGCRNPGANICDAYSFAMPRLSKPNCDRCTRHEVGRVCGWCRHRQPKFDWILAPSLYVKPNPVHDAIRKRKFNNLRALAPEHAPLLARYLDRRPEKFDVFVPVSSHPRRLRSRGFNQAELLASELSKIIESSMDSRLVIRAVNSPSQLQANSRDECWDNGQGDFKSVVSAKSLRILLVDDLETRDATMSACATALKDSGASSVVGIAVARTP
ncbi:MAG TPA: ComF family protein [Dehalococcoidia bacterium]|nr:ComF family protein [SAR202 cluster bacterium]HIM92282.1 ComF family protein [Dehalococcoidia bacterium]